MAYYVSVSVPAAHKSFELNVSSMFDLRHKIAEKLFWINSNDFSDPCSSTRKCVVTVLVQNAYISLHPNADSFTMYVAPAVPYRMYISSEGECFETWWQAFKNFIRYHKTFKKIYQSNTLDDIKHFGDNEEQSNVN